MKECFEIDTELWTQHVYHVVPDGMRKESVYPTHYDLSDLKDH